MMPGKPDIKKSYIRHLDLFLIADLVISDLLQFNQHY